MDLGGDGAARGVREGQRGGGQAVAVELFPPSDRSRRLGEREARVGARE